MTDRPKTLHTALRVLLIAAAVLLTPSCAMAQRTAVYADPDTGALIYPTASDFFGQSGNAQASATGLVNDANAQSLLSSSIRFEDMRGMARVQTKLMEMTADYRLTSRISASPGVMRIVAMGDSMGNRVTEQVARWLGDSLTDYLGVYYEQPQAGSPLVPVSVSVIAGGGAALVYKDNADPDYTGFWNGTVMPLDGAGEYYQFEAHTAGADDSIKCDTARVFYVQESGAGTFDIQVTTVTAGSSGYSTVDTGIDADGALGFGVADVTLSGGLGNYIFRVVRNTGTVRILGFEAYDSTRNAVIFYPTGVGSLTPVGQWDQMPAALMQDLLADMDFDLITWHFADNAAEHLDALDTLSTRITASGVYPSVLLIGNGPTDGNEADQLSVNAYMRELAREQAWAFYSLYYSYDFADWEAWDDQGFAADTVHPNYNVIFAAASQIITKYGLWSPFQLLPAPIRQQARSELDIPVRGGISFSDYTGAALLDITQAGVDVEGYPSEPKTYHPRYGVQFDGSTGYITLGNVFNQAAGSDFSFSLWFKTTASDARLIAEGGNGRIQLRSTSTTLIFSLNDGSDSVTVTTPNSYADGQWHHVAATVDRSETDGIVIYVDGAAIVTGNPTTIDGLDNGSLHIGATNGTAHFLAGSLADVAGFSKSLSASEVTALYERSVGDWIAVNGSSSVGFALPLNEASGSTFYDISGNALNGTGAGAFVHLSPRLPANGRSILGLGTAATAALATTISNTDATVATPGAVFDELAALIGGVSVTVTDDADDTGTVTIQVLDANGASLSGTFLIEFAITADGSWPATLSVGTLLLPVGQTVEQITADAHYRAITDTDGSYSISVTPTGVPDDVYAFAAVAGYTTTDDATITDAP